MWCLEWVAKSSKFPRKCNNRKKHRIDTLFPISLTLAKLNYTCKYWLHIIIEKVCINLKEGICCKKLNEIKNHNNRIDKKPFWDPIWITPYISILFLLQYLQTWVLLLAVSWWANEHFSFEKVVTREVSLFWKRKSNLFVVHMYQLSSKGALLFVRSSKTLIRTPGLTSRVVVPSITCAHSSFSYPTVINHYFLANM